MPFQPDVNEQLEIDGVLYRVVEHPAAPGLPYGQEGRQAIVYQLAAGAERRALKVFKPRFQVPALVALAERLAQYAVLPGLTVCRRTVLTARHHAALLQHYPDLTYSVLMPWVAGPTWMEVLVSGEALTPEQSLALGRALADVLAGMEEQGLAHGDLSASNLLIPARADSAFRAPHSVIELVDVEQMYGPDLLRPAVLTSGSAGYAHHTAANSLWAAETDRFAGAVLLAELLGWWDERVRAAAWGESYFDPAEMQQPTARATLLAAVLEERWGARVAAQFKHAWQSASLADCPTFGQWLVALPDAVPARQPVAPRRSAPAPPPPPPDSGAAPAAATVPVAPRATPGDAEGLAALFADGLAAYQQADWRRAIELLGAVIRQQPGYAQGRYKAVTLFLDAERRLAAPRSRRTRPGWLIAGAVVLLAASLLGGLLLGQAQGTANAQNQAGAQAATALMLTQTQGTSTVRAQATMTTAAQTSANEVTAATDTAMAVAASTGVAGATVTARVQQVGSVTALAQATETAVTAGAASAVVLTARAATVQAVGTSQAQETAIARQSQATAQVVGTAEAQETAIAEQKQATMQAIETTQARVTATAGQATARAQAHAAATAQARVTATAQRRATVAVAQTLHAGATATIQAIISAGPSAILVPVQVAPPDGWVFDSPSQVVLRWNAVRYPFKAYYRYEAVALAPDDGIGFGTNIGSALSGSLVWWCTEGVAPPCDMNRYAGHTFRWRVRTCLCSIGIEEEGDWSPYRTFSIKP